MIIIEDLQTEKLKKWQEFASSNSVLLSEKKSQSQKGITKDRVRQLLENPNKNIDMLRGLSNYILDRNGLYKRSMIYLANLLTYDYIIFPIDSEKNKIKDQFYKAIDHVDSMNLKKNLPTFLYHMLVDGVVYLYKYESSKGVLYTKLPTMCCKIVGVDIDTNIFRYSVDLEKINEADVLSYPDEIQRAYNSFKNSKGNGKDKNYIVSEKGFALPFDKEGVNLLPPMIHLFPDLVDLDVKKDLQADSDITENTKIIHNKVPINKDTGEPIMDLDLVKKFQTMMKRELPDGIAQVTNSFDSEVISLKGSATEKTDDMINKNIKNFYTEIGISSMLFANEKASSEALKKSIGTDAQMLYGFLPMFADFINAELSKFKCKIQFLEINQDNRDEKAKLYRDALANGGSRMMFLSSLGIGLKPMINLLKLEQDIGIDDIMVIKQDAHTMNSDTSESGRPMTDTPTENTEKDRERK